MHGTTVLCVRKDNKVVLVADGQVTMGDHVMKHTARKTRRLYNDKVVAGFAGSTADAITLFERFEGKLQDDFARRHVIEGRKKFLPLDRLGAVPSREVNHFFLGLAGHELLSSFDA